MLKREESAGYLINWAGRLLVREIERVLAEKGLSPGHMPVFFALGNGETLTQKQLAAHASVEQPTMAATLNRMEAAGLITRRADPNDKRSALVSLSPLGRDGFDHAMRAATRINAKALGGLSEPERQELFRLLRTVIATLEAEVPQPVGHAIG